MTNNKRMTEGILYSILFIVGLIVTLYTPFGLITVYLLPLPFIIYSYRNGVKASLFLTVVVFILSVFIGDLYGLFLAWFSSLTGLVMGYYYRKGNALTAVVAGIIVTILHFILAFIMSNILFNTNIIQALQEALLDSLKNNEALFDIMGNSNKEEMMAQYRNFFSNIAQILPFIFISYSLFIVFFNHIMSSMILKRVTDGFPKLIPFRNWKFPKSIIIYYLLSAFVMLIKPLHDIYEMKMIVVNLFPLLQLILTIQGLSFIFYFTYVKNKGGFLRVASVIAVFLPLISQIIHLIGVLDIGFDLRKKIKV